MASCFSLQLEWRGYSEGELRLRVHNRALDLVIVPLCGYWYLAQAAVATTADADTALSGPIWQHLVRLLLALVTLFVLVINVWHLPMDAFDMESLRVRSKMGRWIFLTKHCLVLQAWHQLFSVLAPLSSWLSALTHGISLWVAALGWFMTVQFLLLVRNHPDFLAMCELWESRGVQYKRVAYLVHVPASMVAVLDLIIVKDATCLLATLSFPRTFALPCAYIGFYYLLILLNFRLTGFWPYRAMQGFGGSACAPGWAVFLGAPLVMLLAAVGVNALLLRWWLHGSW